MCGTCVCFNYAQCLAIWDTFVRVCGFVCNFSQKEGGLKGRGACIEYGAVKPSNCKGNKAAH